MTLRAHVLPSPIGDLLIAVDAEGALARLDFLSNRSLDAVLERIADHGDAVTWDEAACRPVVEQLEAYFRGERRDFDLPLAPRGTPFQRAVWQALEEIPYGATRSYRDIAEQLGRPAAVRAVGRANGTNPIPIVVPCHRVIGKDGSLTGYGGGLPIKEHLLRLEGVLLV